MMLLEGISKNHFEQVYDAALRSISAGRDLSLLYNVLMKIDGIPLRLAFCLACLPNPSGYFSTITCAFR